MKSGQQMMVDKRQWRLRKRVDTGYIAKKPDRLCFCEGVPLQVAVGGPLMLYVRAVVCKLRFGAVFFPSAVSFDKARLL